MAALTMDNCGLDSCPVPGGFLTSEPHLAGNALLLAGFAAVIPLNVYFAVRHGTPLYALFLVTGLMLEILGHIGNIMLRENLASRQFFTIHLVGTITAPTFITAAIYVVLPHVLSIYGERFCVIPSPLWIGLLFFGFDAFTLAFQIVGCVFSVDGIARPEMGQGVNILLAGLGVQVASIVLYFAVYYGFLLRLSRHQELLDGKNASVYRSRSFKIFLICLQSAAALILIRTIGRIVQLSGGIESSLFQSQAVSLVLDSTLVLLAVIILSALPPGFAFGSRAWAHTSPHMIGFSSGRLSRSTGGRHMPNYPLQSPSGGFGGAQAPYHSTAYQAVVPLRGQQARGFGNQVPAHYQFPNLHRPITRPRPIQVAPYSPEDDEDAGGKATSSAGLMQPGSASSQSYSQAQSNRASEIRGSKRVSPRQGDMVDEEALWG